MSNIKNIIFDLGGIFLNINYKKTEEAFVQLGVSNFTELYNQHHASTLFENLETGKILPADFYNEFRKIAKTNLTNQQIEDAWNAMLLDLPLDRLEWLQNIKSRYNIYLFSNTNKIHYDCFNKIYASVSNNKNFDNYFIKAYYSHILGMRKPYKESYAKILQEQQLIANETLFIDDTIKNVEGAKEAGLQTIYLIAPQTVLNLDL